MSTPRCIEMRALMFLAACAAIIGAALPVYARTEAEAADELIAVLGVTLPCPYFAVAWLEPPTTLEYRCTPSVEGAFRLREALPGDRIGYIIDMQIARDRYASTYRFRRTPTAPIALAQYVAGHAVPEVPRDRQRGRGSTLIVFSRETASLEMRDTAGASRWVEGFR